MLINLLIYKRNKKNEIYSTVTIIYLNKINILIGSVVT